MDLGMIRKVDIDSEMQQSYLDYAMSVIVARALPDARDGLKPVQRRILYAMYDMGIRHDSSYKKSARIVGEVLGKYHPHGDMAVYEAMARLAQDFTMRYPLVDGQGNFGSIDGDPPAAMRYTEARLAAFSVELLSQIDRETVDFVRNFDDTLDEPLVLPASIPNLLINGASGIAVGMATNIPPHNLVEVVDAMVYMLQRWEKLDDINIETLMGFIKGPDFPTGGIILQEKEENQLQSAYATGKGRVILRGRVHTEEMTRGRNRLIITELPYMVNKASLIERIAELVREGRLEGIADLRDESDRQGMRIVIELKQGVDQEELLRALYAHTPMQTTFGINTLALVDGEPRLLTLKQALRIFLEHRLIVIRRRIEFDLKQAKERAHILEGLRIAIRHLDEIIRLIRSSKDSDQAKEKLIKKYKLSVIQAQAILDMPLKRLAALERKKIEDEYRELSQKIKELESLLRSARKMRQVVIDELLLVKGNYPDRRKTQVVSLEKGKKAAELLTATDLTPPLESWVSITPDGLIGRSHPAGYTKFTSKTLPIHLKKTTTHSTLYLTQGNGQTAALATHALPEAEHPTDGIPLNRASPFENQNVPPVIMAIPARAQDTTGQFIVTVSKMGLVKKSSMEEVPGVSSQLFSLSRVNNGDSLVSEFLTNGNQNIFLVTRKGMAIKFHESEARSMGLIASGVNGIKLGQGDEIVHAAALYDNDQIIMMDSSGCFWRIQAGEYPLQKRYGRGVSACKISPGMNIIKAITGSTKHTIYILMNSGSLVSVKDNEIQISKRTRKGQSFVTLKPGDAINRVLAIDLEIDRKRENSSKSRKQKKRKTQRMDLPAGKIIRSESSKLKVASGARKKNSNIKKRPEYESPTARASKPRARTADKKPREKKGT